MGNLVFQATLGGQVNLVGPNTASTFNLNVPAVSSTIATLTGTETFTNKTLTAPTLTSPNITTALTLTSAAGTSGQVLTSAGSGAAPTWTTVSASQWTTTGSNIYYTTGSVGIGTTSPNAPLEVFKTSNKTAIFGNATANNGNYITLAGASTTPNWVISNNMIVGAEFGIGRTSTNGGTDIGSTHDFMINTSGLVGIGTTSPTAQLQVQRSSSSADVFAFKNTSATTPNGGRFDFTAAAPNSIFQYFLVCNDNAAQRFAMRSDGGLANYSANNVNLSDRQEKKDFLPAKSYLETICAIPVQTFNYIDQTDELPNLGVVAQDVQAVAPELVSESDWSTEKDGSKMRLSVYQTDLQYALMKSIQELKTLNDTLTARIVALEAK